MTIFETEYWIWSLRPHQATVGAGVLSLKRECVTFGELKQEEFTDLSNIIKVIENTLELTFGYNVINYLMLMMVDKHVHYHIIPRYEKEIEVIGEIWRDLTWPNLPILSGVELDKIRSEDLLRLIKENLQDE